MVLTLLATSSALLVVTSTSTVYSVLWLVTTFIIVSLVLGLLNIGFVALLYVIVYVGAIAILFLFVVQLLDLGSLTELGRDKKQSVIPLASVITVSIASIIVLIEQYLSSLDNFGELFSSNNSFTPVISTTQLEALSSVVENNHVHIIADWFYGPGLLPLIIISIILLVAMIAPIYLCNRE